MYVYRSDGTGSGLHTVGFYEPATNDWVPESDHGTEKDAADRVHYLNGGVARREIETMIETHILAHTEGAPHFYPDGSSA